MCYGYFTHNELNVLGLVYSPQADHPSPMKHILNVLIVSGENVESLANLTRV